MPTRGEWPLKPSPSPAAFAMAASRQEMARPVRSPKTRSLGGASSGRMRRSAAAARGPT